MTKKPWKSKTFGFGLLYIVISVAGLLGFGEFQPSPELVEIGGVVTGVIVILLRLITKQPIG